MDRWILSLNAQPVCVPDERPIHARAHDRTRTLNGGKGAHGICRSLSLLKAVLDVRNAYGAHKRAAQATLFPHRT